MAVLEDNPSVAAVGGPLPSVEAGSSSVDGSSLLGVGFAGVDPVSSILWLCFLLLSK